MQKSVLPIFAPFAFFLFVKFLKRKERKVHHDQSKPEIRNPKSNGAGFCFLFCSTT
jgi:hypothetical protein